MVCENLTFLGARDGRTQLLGLEVGWTRAGQEEASAELVQAWSSQAPLDILLCAAWPAGIEQGVPMEAEQRRQVEGRGSTAAAALASASAARYVFSWHAEVYWERPPYASGRGHASRFISLVPLTHPNRRLKSLYAFATSPLARMEPALRAACPPNLTANPFPPPSALRGTLSAAAAGPGSRKRTHEEASGSSMPISSCWFCLATPGVDSHLVASVGRELYLALAKGGLSGENVLLVPIAHLASSAVLHEPARAELRAYLDALAAWATPRRLLVWERCLPLRSGPPHMQLQVMPVPATLEVEELVRTARELGAGRGVEEMGAGRWGPESVGGHVFFFAAGLYEAGRGFLGGLMERLPPGSQHPVHFGRHLACRLLGLPEERIDWRACQLPRAEEVRAVAQFTRSFRRFDSIMPSAAAASSSSSSSRRPS
jgi:hypothetical protein